MERRDGSLSAVCPTAPPSFRKVDQTGGTKLPAVDADWATESCIDVQWAHATTVTATLPDGLVAPKGLAVKILARDTVQVTWNATSGATAYSVYALEGMRLTRVGGTGARRTTMKVTGLRPGATLSFAVRAENATSSATAGWVTVTLPR